MKSNEVIVKASHSINLGKSYVKPSSMMLTKNARATLATNNLLFKK